VIQHVCSFFSNHKPCPSAQHLEQTLKMRAAFAKLNGTQTMQISQMVLRWLPEALTALSPACDRVALRTWLSQVFFKKLLKILPRYVVLQKQTSVPCATNPHQRCPLFAVCTPNSVGFMYTQSKTFPGGRLPGA